MHHHRPPSARFLLICLSYLVPAPSYHCNLLSFPLWVAECPQLDEPEIHTIIAYWIDGIDPIEEQDHVRGRFSLLSSSSLASWSESSRQSEKL